jgi:hypothetical protein
MAFEPRLTVSVDRPDEVLDRRVGVLKHLVHFQQQL